MDHAYKIAEKLGAEEAICRANKKDMEHAGLQIRTISKITRTLQEHSHLKELEETTRFGAKMLTFGFPGYPEQLNEIPGAPPVLFCLGKLPADNIPMLAIIGSRRCTPESERIARIFGNEMGSLNISVASGMARGIDSAAIRGCLSGGGRPVGVLGCGINMVYPSENVRLYSDTRREGALLSEFPLNTPPQKKNFPRRNRIISGLSLGVLVIAASKKSGSLITVDHALAQNKTVMAVPGPVGPDSYFGSNCLIRDGASVILEADDILAALYLSRPRKAKSAEKDTSSIDCVSDHILKICRHEALTVEAIAGRTTLDWEHVMTIVSRLETEGKVKRIPGARFICKSL